MASLTNTKIKDTYDGLLKTTDNDALGGTYKLITDGLGNSSGLYLGTGGRLGINQSSPLSKLHITNDSGGSGGYLKVTDAVHSGDVRFGMADGVDNDAVLGVWTNNNVKIYTNSSERLRIDSSGNVTIRSGNKLILNRPDNAIDSEISTDSSGTLILNSRNGEGFDFQNGGTSFFTADSSGRLGLGLTPYTTSSLLNLKGDGLALKNDENGGNNNWSLIQNLATGTQSSINFTSGQGLAMTIAHDKNVGIGTSSPIDKVHAAGGFTSTGLAAPSSTSIGSVQLGYDGTNGVLRTWNSSPIQLSSYGHIQFDTSGSERLRIDSSGKLLINTSNTSSGGMFRVRQATNFNVASISDGSGVGFVAINDDVSSNVNFMLQGTEIYFKAGTGAGAGTERLRITSGGEVIIADQKVLRSRYNSTDDYSATFNWATLQLGNNGPNRIIGGKTAAGGSLQFWVNNTNEASAYGVTPNGINAMTITSGGEVYIGTSSTSVSNGAFTFRSIGATNTFLDIGHKTGSSSGASFAVFRYNGTQIGDIAQSGTTAVAYNTTSDYRLKENVVDMTGALDRVDQLEPKRFNFIADEDTTVDGFLAHEVQDIVPEAVTGEKDATEEYEVSPEVLDDEGNVVEEAVMGTRDVYQGIDQSKLVPLLVGAIKELKAEIETLKSQINS